MWRIFGGVDCLEYVNNFCSLLIKDCEGFFVVFVCLLLMYDDVKDFFVDCQKYVKNICCYLLIVNDCEGFFVVICWLSVLKYFCGWLLRMWRILSFVLFLTDCYWCITLIWRIFVVVDCSGLWIIFVVDCSCCIKWMWEISCLFLFVGYCCIMLWAGLLLCYFTLLFIPLFYVHSFVS